MSMSVMSLNNLPQVIEGIPVLRVNPNHLDELFRIAVVTKHAQRLLQSEALSPYTLALQAKVNIRDYPQLVVEEHVFVRIPETVQERKTMQLLSEPEVLLFSKDSLDKVVVLNEGTTGIRGGSEQEKAAFKALWKETDKELPLWRRLVGITKEVFWGLLYKKRGTSGVSYPFPLFRSQLLNVFQGTKKEVLSIILESLRERYVAKRDIEKVPAKILVTPNLDHLRFLFDIEHEEFKQVYKDSFLHTADGYPPLVMFGKASLGYQPAEQVTGVDLFMQLINTIGNEALPYTIYIVGGFGNVPYKTRDYFLSIYPHMKENFVGISTPPFGFLENKEIMDAIVADINEKKPDIIFAGMTVPTQEIFVHRLKKLGVNFGIAFCIGRAIELIAGFQKKEPSLIDKLHLAWIYRMFFDQQKHIRKRQRDRVLKDFKFVFRTLFTK